jgi:DNA-3-methyladenine glycosylase I
MSDQINPDETAQVACVQKAGALKTNTGLVRARWAERDSILTDYYDREWGVPVRDEAGVFERLSLEGFQTGLSWLTVLRKRDAFRDAFDGFEVDAVAMFDNARIEALVAHTGIIRNRRKIEAVVSNARAAQRLRESGVGLEEIVWSYQPLCTPLPECDDEVPTTSDEAHALTRDLKKRGFTFVGPTIIFALMAAIGVVDAHLVGSHRRGCSGLWNADGTRAD